jgi:general secretion pathway protein D
MFKIYITALLMMLFIWAQSAHAQQSMDEVFAQMDTTKTAEGSTPNEGADASLSEAGMIALLQDKGIAQYNQGNYDEAIRIFDSILSFDEYYAGAISYKKRAYERIANRESKKIDVQRAEAMSEVSLAWNAESRPLTVAAFDESLTMSDMDDRASAAIVKRLKSTMIPVLDVAESTVEEVLRFFAETSRAKTGSDSDIDFLLVGMEYAEADNNITISVDNMSLYEALQYVVEMASLKFEITRDLVIVMPANYVPHARLVMRSYDVIPEVGADMMSAVDSNGGGDDLFGASSSGSGAGPIDVSGFFSLIEFPEGATAVFQPRFNKLFVKNTAKNLMVIETVLDDFEEEAIQRRSHQVEIETKFVEFTDGALEELGFDWTVYGDGSVASFEFDGEDDYYQKSSGFLDVTEGANAATPPLNGSAANPNAKQIYTDPVTGQRLVSQEKNGQSLFGSAQRENTSVFDSVGSGILSTLGGSPSALVFQNGDVDLRITALEQEGTADVLSAPKVVAKSGTEAFISVAETHRYPQDYDVTTGQRTSPVVRPQDWQDFDMGVSLRVTPTVDADNHVIELDLVPEILVFKGYEDYVVGYNAYDGGGNNSIFPSGNGNAFLARMPFFQRRVVETQVVIADGSTVVMGGLVDERTETFRDQVPFLGDIPYLGRLFRTEGSRHVKKNLTIFVKATQIDPNGMTRTDRELASY